MSMSVTMMNESEIDQIGGGFGQFQPHPIIFPIDPILDPRSLVIIDPKAPKFWTFPEPPPAPT
jgi:hypothetical protein